jgi:cytochrome bd-type quinol oxidase subunit 1
MAIMLTSTGYIDKVSHTCFILMATAGFLLLARAAFKTDEGEEEEANKKPSA